MFVSEIQFGGDWDWFWNWFLVRLIWFGWEASADIEIDFNWFWNWLWLIWFGWVFLTDFGNWLRLILKSTSADMVWLSGRYDAFHPLLQHNQELPLSQLEMQQKHVDKNCAISSNVVRWASTFKNSIKQAAENFVNLLFKILVWTRPSYCDCVFCAVRSLRLRDTWYNISYYVV